jgi:hypothetical protein
MGKAAYRGDFGWRRHAEIHGRAPGVEHGGDADPGAQVLGIGGDGEHGVGRGLEQQIVDHGLVLVGDVGDRCRQREHDVEVRTGNSSASRAASHCLAAAP